MNETSASTSSCSGHTEITLLILISLSSFLLDKNPNITIMTLQHSLTALYLNRLGLIFSRLRARLPAQGVELAELPRDPLESDWSLLVTYNTLSQILDELYPLSLIEDSILSRFLICFIRVCFDESLLSVHHSQFRWNIQLWREEFFSYTSLSSLISSISMFSENIITKL